MNLHKFAVSTSNPEACRAIANDPRFTSEMLFLTQPNGHQFNVGDTVALVGLKQFPEFNGETVKIVGIREDGPYGKAYYVKGRINEAVNWVYENRLKANERSISA